MTSPRLTESRPRGDELGELVVQRVRMRVGLRLAWLRHLAVAGHRDHDIATGDLDRLDDEAAWRSSHAPPELLDAITTADDGSSLDSAWRGASLARVFGLDRAEFDLLQVAYASATDDRLARIAAATADRPYLTEAGAFRVCDHGHRAVSPESPLRLWNLIRLDPTAPGEPPALTVDSGIAAWLDGLDELDTELAAIAHRGVAHEPLASWPLDVVAAACTPRNPGDQPDRRRIVVRGRSGTGRRSFAVAAAESLGLGSIVVTAREVDAPTQWTIIRHAYLHRCAPVWCHPIVDRGAGFPIQFVCVGPDDELEPAAGVVDVDIELPPPTTDDRARLWREYVPVCESWPAHRRDDIIERPHVTVADIVDVADRRLTDATETAHHLNARQRAGVGALLDPMPLPYRMSDLIIDDRTRDALEFLLFEIRRRRRRWSGEPEHRLLPMTGIVALLAGPPGVGKTMTAQVIAAELGVDLLRVNLADTISKYVGETAKNLHTVLTEADRLDAVVVFDEADTLFGRRTELRDAHDRYANADTNFLLQAIESYQGVALLATNRRDHVDEAFTRRLRHVVEFPFPDATTRETIWSTLLDALLPDRDRASCDPVVERLAEHCDLNGADIKHAILNARLVADRDDCRVDAAVIVAGLDRELGKHRRALSDLARKRVLGG